MTTLYAGVDPATAKHRYYDTTTSNYTPSDTPPTQQILDQTNASVSSNGIKIPIFTFGMPTPPFAVTRPTNTP